MNHRGTENAESNPKGAAEWITPNIRVLLPCISSVPSVPLWFVIGSREAAEPELPHKKQNRQKKAILASWQILRALILRPLGVAMKRNSKTRKGLWARLRVAFHGDA